ncbi:unnamed protein product [Lathyrus sativus]|nr:unnamed protein product [Lathyrus sativus]
MEMTDQSIQIQLLAERFQRFVLDCELKQSSNAPPSDNAESKEINENSDSMDEFSISNGIHENSPDLGHTLPILKKILDLSTKVQDLKKQHVALTDHVKFTTESFSGLDILNSIQLLGTEYELLKKKYLDESSERKRLYNEIIEIKGNIRVFCRCRPLSASETGNGYTSVVNFESTLDNELQVINSDSSKKSFKFDHVFKPEDNQEAVFSQTKPIAISVLDGFNVCIFAYGQTGTGKTFTMEGTPEERGVNYRTLEELFKIYEERKGVMKYQLHVSMLEVYNEKLKDLLVENSAQPKKLEIKQSAEGTQEVPGLVETQVHGTDDVWELLKTGNRVRSVGSTSANEQSSRSHCLLRVTVVGESLINGQKTRSHLWLVDLAGSERVGKTEAEGERLKESQFINKSLSALGDVISALASKAAHIPYRNSKLTHILQSSLGGDCKTLMLVQVSPSSADLGETLCSLNFATRVRGIESGPARKQVDLSDLFKNKQMAEKAKHDEKEIKKLQESLQSLQIRFSTKEFTCKSLQEKVRDLENQLAEERKTRLKQENRSLAAVSAQPPTFFKQTTVTDKRPPLIPSNSRMPLGRITNFIPFPSPKRSTRYTSIHQMNGKENSTRRNSATADTEGFARPRSRASIAMRPPVQSTTQILKPRRRVSIATLRPDPTSEMTTGGSSVSTKQILKPRRRVSIATLRPDPTSEVVTTGGSSVSTKQILKPKRRVSIATLGPDPVSEMTTGGSSASTMRSQRGRYSNLFVPLTATRTSVDTTPIQPVRCRSKFIGSPLHAQAPIPVRGSSSKFMGSPVHAGVGSRLGKFTSAFALQRKPVVWSPLALRAKQKPSILPSQLQ